MELLNENVVSIISVFFGTGGIVYAVVTRLLDRKKYSQEVRAATSEADIKGDEFWKQRYDVLQKEVENKDNWWKDRYDALYKEYENERTLSNEIVKSFRTELNEMRNDYEQQREIERQKYDKLMEQYRTFEEESKKRESEYKERIATLEDLVSKYEHRLESKKLQ